MRNALWPLYLRVLGCRTVRKSSYLPQTRHAKNRTDAFEEGTWIFCVKKNLFFEESAAKKDMRNALRPLYLRVLGFRTLNNSSYLPQNRCAKNRTDAFEEDRMIFCIQNFLF